MSEKQEMIARMLELQQQFIEYEHKNGVSGKDYYASPEGTFLNDFRKEYADLANKVVNLAHSEVGSIRD